MTIKSWLGKDIETDNSVVNEPMVVQPRHNAVALERLTKREVIAYANTHGIKINSRKKKEELIDIIIRS